MKNKPFSLPLIVTFAALTLGAWAANQPYQQTDSGEYRIVALRDCQIVAEFPMSAEQLTAYQSLSQQEKTMQQLQKPIQGIEVSMQSYSQRISALSAQAISENKGGVVINHVLLEQQKHVVDEFEHFMQRHQGAFDALEAQGSHIAKVAEQFESLILPVLGTLQFDQIHIASPYSTDAKATCLSLSDKM